MVCVDRAWVFAWCFGDRACSDQLSKLQSLTRRPHQKPDALAWIEAQWALPPQMNEALLRFFVTSGWASGGHSPHSQDPEWRWQISEGHGQ